MDFRKVVPTNLVDEKYGRIYLEADRLPSNAAIAGYEPVEIPDAGENGEEEPAFLLRAQDTLFTPTLAAYEQLYVSVVKATSRVDFSSQMSDEAWAFADGVDSLRESGRQWQRANRDRTKIPD